MLIDGKGPMGAGFQHGHGFGAGGGGSNDIANEGYPGAVILEFI